MPITTFLSLVLLAAHSALAAPQAGPPVAPPAPPATPPAPRPNAPAIAPPGIPPIGRPDNRRLTGSPDEPAAPARPAAPATPGDGTPTIGAPTIGSGRLYVGLKQPVTVTLAPAPPSTALVELALLDWLGGTIARVSRPAGETFSLGDLMPEIWTLDRAAYLQLLVDEAPVGSALVIQPLINRAPVRTAEAIRPDGRTPYVRVIGWGNELLDPENPEHLKLKENWKAGEPVVMSGLRIYPERDVQLETSLGPIRVALRPDEAPNTAWNFRHLVEHGFYDGTTFHRVVPVDRAGRPFVIQGGDPTGTGDGGPGWDLPLERSRVAHDFGVISMARGDAPDTAGSQFFFGLSRDGTARLDTQYCAFGEAVDAVKQGAETIVRISQVELADPATGRPTAPPTITRATLVDAPPRLPGKGRTDARVERPVKKEESGPDR